MDRSTPRRRALWSATLLCLLAGYVSAASTGRKALKADSSDSGDRALPDAVAGPIVKAVVDRLKHANGTDTADKKKTIAQMIDEALEQEFPEEKEEKIEKNYNETAKNSDVGCMANECCGCP